MEVTQMIDSLLSDDIEQKLASVRNIKTIAQALGKNKI